MIPRTRCDKGVAATPASEMKIERRSETPRRCAAPHPLPRPSLCSVPRTAPSHGDRRGTSKWKKEVAEFWRVRSLLRFARLLHRSWRSPRRRESGEKEGGRGEGRRERGAHHVEGARGRGYSGCAPVSDDSLVIRYVKAARMVDRNLGSTDISLFFSSSCIRPIIFKRTPA